MEIVIANVNEIDFKIERDLNGQLGALPLPFQGMDKSTAAVCLFFNASDGCECEKNDACPFRHIREDRTIVCKHWLRGLCKKGDQCEFLHEYDMTKMPECYFYSRFNACHNKECPFLHIDPESKIKDCPWYDRGFCRHGPHCRHRHVRRVLCMNYLAGFCNHGENCKYVHPKFELPPPPEATKDQVIKRVPTCHYCGDLGHKASGCNKMSVELKESTIKAEDGRIRAKSYKNFNQQSIDQYMSSGSAGRDEQMENDKSLLNPKPAPKPLEEITCFKCGNKGHYANKCPKGHLAFLSNHLVHTKK